MKNIVKKFDRVGLMVLLAAFFVAVGFTAAEKMENAPVWYEVEITDLNFPNLPENQKIIREYPGGEPEGDCDYQQGEMCAVELSSAPGVLPTTVFDANDIGITTGKSKHEKP